jgi:uncharacterized protein YegL
MIDILLDRSGSMSGRETDVVGGVNTFIQEQQKLPDPAVIAISRFDSGAPVETFVPMTDLKEARLLTHADFQPRGGTPLLDAIGSRINALEGEWLTHKPDRCIMMIVTDGQENASREFDLVRIKALIEARQKSGLWSFIYLGADVNAFDEGSKLGIPQANVAGYTKSAAGVKAAFAAASEAYTNMRATGDATALNLGKANLGEDEASARAHTPMTQNPSPDVVLGQNTTAWAPPATNAPVPAAVDAATWSPPC